MRRELPCIWLVFDIVQHQNKLYHIKSTSAENQPQIFGATVFNCSQPPQPAERKMLMQFCRYLLTVFYSRVQVCCIHWLFRKTLQLNCHCQAKVLCNIVKFSFLSVAKTLTRKTTYFSRS